MRASEAFDTPFPLGTLVDSIFYPTSRKIAVSSPINGLDDAMLWFKVKDKMRSLPVEALTHSKGINIFPNEGQFPINR